MGTVLKRTNTIVTSCDNNYFWGALFLVGSMRMNDMNEPVIILHKGFTPAQCALFEQFPQVSLVEMKSRTKRSLTCSKPIVMLMAKTEYVSWVDCDGFFANHCSEALLPPSDAFIHARLRRREENADVFRGRYRQDDVMGNIPKHINEIWQRNIHDQEVPRLQTCVSACCLTVATKYQDFLSLWLKEMESRIVDSDLGVVDHRSPAYFQLDESVLNSVLSFSSTAPRTINEWPLASSEHLFIHFIALPKPWQCWCMRSWRHHDQYLAVSQYLLKTGILAKRDLPWTLRPDFSFLHLPAGCIMTAWYRLRHIFFKLCQRWKTRNSLAC